MTEQVFDAFQVSPDRRGVVRDLGSIELGAGRIRYPDIAPAALEDVCASLTGSRGTLRRRPVRDLIRWLGGVGRRFLDPADPLRAEALEHLPWTSSLSGPMCAAVLDGMAGDWVEERLLTLVDRELASADALDGFVGQGVDKTMAIGPALTTQILSGSVPGVGVSALIRSLLLKSPTLLKPGLGDCVLPVLFARGLQAADPELGGAMAVLYWPGGKHDLEDVALERAEVVTVYGGDETVRALRARTPVTTRFVGYHHRVGVGVVGREALRPDVVDRVATEIAGAVGFFDRRGCVSPQTVYVEKGGVVDLRAFAERVAWALQALQQDLPEGQLHPEEASALQQLRGTTEMLAASGADVDIQHGGTADWTVVFDPGGLIDSGCGGRVVKLRALNDLGDLAEELEPLRGHLQTVAVAGLGSRTEGLAETLAELGVSRVVPFDSAPFPPPWWHHDGGGPLRDLVRWVDLTDR